MRRHAKAPSAATTDRQACGLGRFVRGGLATGASSSRGDGRGAPAFRAIRLALISLVALSALVFAASASATQYQRPFIENFGSVEQPTTEWGAILATEKATGNVLIAERSVFEPGSPVDRYHSDGTPAPFAALGSNMIDGKEGPGGKPCSEEPASCDQTPQNYVEISSGTQIAIDESGGITDGDIYISQPGLRLIDIFSGAGKYLGQLTGIGFEDFPSTCGVAVDGSGALYVSAGEEVAKFVATANPPTNSDLAWRTDLKGYEGPCNLALGTGSTAGSLFVTNDGGNSGNPEGGPHMGKIDTATGEYVTISRTVAGNLATVPTSGNLIIEGPSANELDEVSISGDSVGPVVSRVFVEPEELTGEPEEAGGVNSLGAIEGFELDGSNNLYVSYSRIGVPPTPVAVFGAPAIVPTVTVNPPNNVTGTKATLTGVVDPEGLEVEDCYFEYGLKTEFGTQWEAPVPCEGAIPADNAEHAVHASISGLQPNGAEYSLRLLAKNENGTERSETIVFRTAFTVATEPATKVDLTSATLNGTLRPEGSGYENCFFEYGLASSASFEGTAPCSPAAATIEPDFSPHPVSAAIEGLQPSRTYRFRLVATNFEGQHQGEELTFTTLGAPRFTELRARDADQSSVTIEAKVNPSGFGTSYHFEWGTSTAYGNEVPAEYEPFIGSGTEPVLVKAKLKGLSPGTVYHYRLVATNKAGTASSSDQEAETLDSCGLPDGRCFEMVSPREPGQVASPGTAEGNLEMHFQAGDSAGLMAYIIEAGLPNSTSGSEVLYRSARETSGWNATQLSPPITSLNQTGSAHSGRVRFLSPDLSCGATEANTPLTDDPGPQYMFDAGGTNLYRRNSDGSYTAITKLPPEKADPSGAYRVLGLSNDCSKVVFASTNTYPGVPGAGEERLYEWEEGTLRSVGFVPGPNGEEAVVARSGAPENSANLVSEDGSRVFFSANRKESPNPEEVGAGGIFVREDGTTTRDVSQSTTATPDQGATYEYATPDGSRAFFTANAGLTAESSSEGTDLYEYDLESSTLTDLSVGQGPGGARVAGFVGASRDGLHVYFAARGQLVPGQGRTFAQNQKQHSYSIYGAVDGEVSFAGTITEGDLSAVAVDRLNQWTSRVSPNGRYLMFESSVDNTGYQGGGAAEVFLYDSEADGEEPTVCVSCRQDGQPSANTFTLLRDGFTANASNPMRPEDEPRSLVLVNGKPRVFFTSGDALAPGAPAPGSGSGSLYEWAHGQVFRVVSDEEGALVPEGLLGTELNFAGASSDGTDLYFSSPETLTWEDTDGRFSVYDARVAGGFPQPPPPPANCDAQAEGSCQGPPAPAPATPAPESSTFNGPGNPKPKAKKHKKHRKHHGRKKHHHSKKRARHANNDRRVGK